MSMMISEKHLGIIKNILDKNIPEYLSVNVYLFGSRAIGTAKPASDIDLGIECKDTSIPFKILLALQGAFEDSDLPVFVDIIDLLKAPELLQKEVYQKGIIIWNRGNNI